jgi:putative PIN family toxin of toxin-antitoxin system
VLVSAFAFGGRPREAVARAAASATCCVSRDLLAEYRAVPQELLDEGKLTHDQWRALVAGMAAFVAEAQVVVTRRSLRVCRDPADNMVLECCLAARADFLVTGDRDLLDLPAAVMRASGLGQLRIMTPRAYVSA